MDKLPGGVDIGESPAEEQEDRQRNCESCAHAVRVPSCCRGRIDCQAERHNPDVRSWNEAHRPRMWCHVRAKEGAHLDPRVYPPNPGASGCPGWTPDFC